MTNFSTAERMRALTDAQNELQSLRARIAGLIVGAAQDGQYTITVDVESRVACKQQIMDELRAAGYAVSGTRGVKTFRIAWK